MDKTAYYSALMFPRKTGNFENYIEYFLQAIISTSKQVIETMNEIDNVLIKTKSIFEKMKGENPIKIYNFIIKNPVFNITICSKECGLSFPTTNSIITELVKKKVIQNINNQARNKTYKFVEYIDILEKGTKF